MEHDTDINTQSPLLNVAAELRNNIYERVLVQQKPVELHAVHGLTVHKPPRLLQTCHQIRSEATKIYYANNAFLAAHRRKFRLRLRRGRARFGQVEDFLANGDLQPWLRSLSSNAHMSLRRISLDDRVRDLYWVVGDEDGNIIREDGDSAAAALDLYRYNIWAGAPGIDHCEFFIGLNVKLFYDNSNAKFTDEPRRWTTEPISEVEALVEEFKQLLNGRKERDAKAIAAETNSRSGFIGARGHLRRLESHTCYVDETHRSVSDPIREV